MIRFWRSLYSLLGLQPPTVPWRSYAGNTCWFSKGYDPRKRDPAGMWKKLKA